MLQYLDQQLNKILEKNIFNIVKESIYKCKNDADKHITTQEEAIHYIFEKLSYTKNNTIISENETLVKKGQLEKLYSNYILSHVENDINVSTTDVNTTNSAEIKRRYTSLLMYFMRDQLYNIFSGPILQSIFGTLAKIPLFGLFFEYFLEMLDYMKRYYFFCSGI